MSWLRTFQKGRRLGMGKQFWRVNVGCLMSDYAFSVLLSVVIVNINLLCKIVLSIQNTLQHSDHISRTKIYRMKSLKSIRINLNSIKHSIIQSIDIFET